MTTQTQDFKVGDAVRVLSAIWLNRVPKQEKVIGEGVVQRITHQSSDGTPLYWVSGFLTARTSNVLRPVSGLVFEEKSQ